MTWALLVPASSHTATPCRNAVVYTKVNSNAVLRLTASGQLSGEAPEADDFWITGGYAVGPSLGGDIVYTDAYEYNFMTGVERGWLSRTISTAARSGHAHPVESGTNWLFSDPTLDWHQLYVASTGGDAEYSSMRSTQQPAPRSGSRTSPSEPTTTGSQDIVVRPAGPKPLHRLPGRSPTPSHGQTASSHGRQSSKTGSGDFIPHTPTCTFTSSPGHHLNIPNAIDPLALILPGWLYVAINKPYPPTRRDLVARIQALTRDMPVDDKAHLRNRAAAVGAYVSLIEQAFADDTAPED